MLINGKERGFELNIQAHREIAENLPGRDFGKLGEVYKNAGSLDTIDTDIMVAIALNRGYEDHRHHDDPSYTPEYLTAEDFRFFDVNAWPELEQLLLATINGDSAQEIETEAPKAPKGKKTEETKAE